MAKKSSTTTTAAGRDPSTEPLATGVFAFEGDWESDLRDPWSIEPMLRTLQVIGELKCIRRNVATVPELEHYLDKWLQKRYAGYQVGYFGFHGGPGSLWLGGKRYVSLEDLEALIDGRAQGRIIHFGSCSVMRVGESRLKAFTAASATSSASRTSTDCRGGMMTCRHGSTAITQPEKTLREVQGAGVTLPKWHASKCCSPMTSTSCFASAPTPTAMTTRACGRVSPSSPATTRRYAKSYSKTIPI